MSNHRLKKKVFPANRIKLTEAAGIGRAEEQQLPLTDASQSPGEFEPSFEEIQKLAYEIHEQKGGSELENWLEAERMIKERRDVPMN
jgi:hypothetical protein